MAHHPSDAILQHFDAIKQFYWEAFIDKVKAHTVAGNMILFVWCTSAATEYISISATSVCAIESSILELWILSRNMLPSVHTQLYMNFIIESAQ